MPSLVKTESALPARPLGVLVPLIQNELEAGDRAGIEHYRKAGELLIEAKTQVVHGQWGGWLDRHFHLHQTTARRYMQLVREIESRPRERFASVREATRPFPEPQRIVPEVWHEPVKRITGGLNMAALQAEQQSREKERKLTRELALKLIDIGYKVLATKLHEDKGGSHEAMTRLNKVRAILRGAVE